MWKPCALACSEQTDGRRTSCPSSRRLYNEPPPCCLVTHSGHPAGTAWRPRTMVATRPAPRAAGLKTSNDSTIPEECGGFWSGELLPIFDDMLYTAHIPSNVERGMTVLLAKTGSADDWVDTCPISFSSTILQNILAAPTWTGRPLCLPVADALGSPVGGAPPFLRALGRHDSPPRDAITPPWYTDVETLRSRLQRADGWPPNVLPILHKATMNLLRAVS